MPYDIWYELQFVTLSEEQKDLPGIKLSEFLSIA